MWQTDRHLNQSLADCGGEPHEKVDGDHVREVSKDRGPDSGHKHYECAYEVDRSSTELESERNEQNAANSQACALNGDRIRKG